jgi:uncharacterized membrane protein YagU involved in acid resistance
VSARQCLAVCSIVSYSVTVSYIYCSVCKNLIQSNILLWNYNLQFLYVYFQAPVIIIPVNSKSCDVLIMDFGNLTMYNKFRTLNVQSSAGYPAVVDELNLDLQNLKLSR